jgi:hypothetical protein
MRKVKMTFQAIPQWALPAKADARAMFETAALLGIEGQWIRLSAADQRAIMGHDVFGMQEFCVCEDGTIRVRRSVAFGMDKETGAYECQYIQGAINAQLRIAPGVSGARFYAGGQ